MLIYISGEKSYTDLHGAEYWLTAEGYKYINPYFLLSVCPFFDKGQYTILKHKLIEMADGIFMPHDWQKSKEAVAELSYAKSLGKKVIYQDYYGRNKKGCD